MTSPTPLPATSVAAAAHRLRLSSEDRRRQLLRHAVELFSRRGFSGTRTKDIAAACGVSEAILFRHFATKEDLYQAILASYKSAANAPEWMAEMKKLAAARKDAEFVRYFVELLFKSFREDATFHRLMLHARLDGHVLADMVHERLGMPAHGIVRDYIAQRQREGAFRAGDPGLMALFVFSAVSQQATFKFVFGVDILTLPDEQRVEQISNMLLAALQAPAKNKMTKKSRKKSSL